MRILSESLLILGNLFLFLLKSARVKAVHTNRYLTISARFTVRLDGIYTSKCFLEESSLIMVRLHVRTHDLVVTRYKHVYKNSLIIVHEPACLLKSKRKD